MDKHASNLRLGELDALRGIAASMVMLFHYTYQIGVILPHVEAPEWGFFGGRYGVELFFGISGFVIFMTLDKASRASDFVVSRVARLFPAYWAGIVLTTLAVYFLNETSLQQSAKVIGANFSMLQGFLYLPSVDGVYWSLTIELGFYACMLALWRLKWLGRIEAILLGWIALKILWWAVPDLPYVLGLLLLTEYIPYFAIGIVSYRVWNGARTWLQQLPVLAIGLLASAIVDPQESVIVYCGVIVVFWAMAAGYLKRLITRPLVWLGGISYPLYLIHQNIGYGIIDHAERLGFSVWPAIAIAIVACLALADLIHRMIEVPSGRVIRGWWKSLTSKHVLISE